MNIVWVGLTFPWLPQVVGHIAEERLQEEDKADPLVPSVPHFVSLLGDLDQVGVVRVKVWIPVVQRRDSGVSNVGANFSGNLRWDGKGAVDPAVSVHDA